MLSNCNCCTDCEVQPEVCSNVLPFTLFPDRDVPVGPVTFNLDILTAGGITMADGDLLQDGNYDDMVAFLDANGCQSSNCLGQPGYTIDSKLKITPLIAPFSFFYLKNAGDGYVGANEDLLKVAKSIQDYPDSVPVCDLECHYTQSINFANGGYRRYHLRKIQDVLVNPFYSFYCSECQDRYNDTAPFDDTIGYSTTDTREALVGSAFGFTTLSSTTVSTQSKIYFPFLESYTRGTYSSPPSSYEYACECTDAPTFPEYSKIDNSFSFNVGFAQFGALNFTISLCFQCGFGITTPPATNDCFSTYYGSYSFGDINPFCWQTRDITELCSSTNVDIEDRNPYEQVTKSGLSCPNTILNLALVKPPSHILLTSNGSPITTYQARMEYFPNGLNNIIGCAFKFQPGKTKLKITQPFSMTAFSSNDLGKDRRRFYLLTVCEAGAGAVMSNDYISIYIDMLRTGGLPARCDLEGDPGSVEFEYALVCNYPGNTAVIAPTTSTSRIQYDNVDPTVTSLGIEIERHINPQWNNRLKKITFLMNDVIVHEKTYPGFGGIFGPQDAGHNGRGICDNTVLEWRASVETGDARPVKASAYSTTGITPYAYTGYCDAFYSECANTNPIIGNYNNPTKFVDPYSVTITSPSLQWS